MILKLMLCAFLLTSVNEAQAAFLKVLSKSTIRSIVGPYPAPGSEEEAKDFEIMLDLQATRTPEQCAEAATQETGTLKNIFYRNNGPLTKREANILTVKLLKAYAEAGINIYIAKGVFKRPRPYKTRADIVPCIGLESSYAYPSGHTTVARVFARILSRIYPERAEAFMKRADEAAHHRVLGGVHHPSDIEAGKKLGDVLSDHVMKTTNILKEARGI
ncbi:phosphatase PAP2 family protein [Peredibacter sp. HCB2-198]|uniref:phosphatase PAP2 family protein n=1 Tax=Peredibacter sp. HCB2-198 TaxID=3383025 RepID=UPI0038B4E72E